MAMLLRDMSANTKLTYGIKRDSKHDTCTKGRKSPHKDGEQIPQSWKQ